MFKKILIFLLIAGVAVVVYLALTRDRFYSTHSRKALEYYQQGVDNMMKYYIPEGMRDMRLAADEDPDFPLPRLFLLESESWSSEAKDQAKWYRKLAVSSPKWTDFEQGLISLVLANPEPENRPELAEKIDAFLQKYPSRMDAFLLLIQKYRKLVEMENPEKMIHFYEEMHRRYPNNVQILNMMGYFYVAMGQPEKARVVFEKYVYIRPDEANPYDSFGDFYYNTGQFPRAAEYFRKALKRKPDFVISKIHLAKSLLYMGKVKDALTILNEVEKGSSGDMVENSAVLIRFLCYAFTRNIPEMKKLVDSLPKRHIIDSIRQIISFQYCVQSKNFQCVKEIVEKEKSTAASKKSLNFLMNQAEYLNITGHPADSAALLEKKFSAHILNSAFDIRLYVYYILVDDYIKLGEFKKAESLVAKLPRGYKSYLMMKIMNAAGKPGKAMAFARKTIEEFPGADPDFYVVAEARRYEKQGNRR
ncbi:MAG: hypothetical protein GXO69_09770 [Acidobacteria bacterium]|nr:hypothetical protein [Acidobacteriota bacterium]